MIMMLRILLIFQGFLEKKTVWFTVFEVVMELSDFHDCGMWLRWSLVWSIFRGLLKSKYCYRWEGIYVRNLRKGVQDRL